MSLRSNSAVKLFLVLGMLLLVPLFSPSGTALSAEVVDINRADVAAMIANWKGIGEKKARAIVSYRKKNGAFASVNDLANVKGIGEGLIKKNKKYMSVKGGIKTASKAVSKKSTAKKDTKKATSKTKTSAKSKTNKPVSKKTTSKKSTDKKKKKKTTTSK